MQHKDHRQLDLIGGQSHPHHAQLSRVVLAINMGCQAQLKAIPAAQRVCELLENSYGPFVRRHRSRSGR